MRSQSNDKQRRSCSFHARVHRLLRRPQILECSPGEHLCATGFHSAATSQKRAINPRSRCSLRHTVWRKSIFSLSSHSADLHSNRLQKLLIHFSHQTSGGSVITYRTFVLCQRFIPTLKHARPSIIQACLFASRGQLCVNPIITLKRLNQRLL